MSKQTPMVMYPPGGIYSSIVKIIKAPDNDDLLCYNLFSIRRYRKRKLFQLIDWSKHKNTSTEVTNMLKLFIESDFRFEIEFGIEYDRDYLVTINLSPDLYNVSPDRLPPVEKQLKYFKHLAGIEN